MISQHGLPAMAKVISISRNINIVYTYSHIHYNYDEIQHGCRVAVLEPETCHMVKVSETKLAESNNEDLEARGVIWRLAITYIYIYLICSIDSNLQTNVAQICLVSLFPAEVNMHVLSD